MSKFRLPALNYLTGFEAAARHLSIKKASDELHVSRSAVSRNIQRLERQIGRPLLERRHRGIDLTTEGEILLGAVDTGFSHIQNAIMQLNVNRSPRRLVISVDPDFAALWLVPRLAEFYESVPDILLEIRSERSLGSLDGSRIHCAIHYSDAGTPPAESEILFRSSLFPVCAPGLRASAGLRSPEDLRGQVLLYDRSRVEWQQYLRNVSVKRELGSGIVFSETTHCMEAAARGVGIAIGDDYLAEIHLSEGRLVKPFDWGFLSRNAYYFVAAKGSVGHPAVIAFREWLLRSISRVRGDKTPKRDR